jgi:hypothetical protein
MTEVFHNVREWFRARPRRQKRLKYGLIGLAILILLGAAVRPAAHAIKGWQARRLAGEANTLMQNQQWNEASKKAMDAVKLRPTEPAAIDAIAHLLSRTGRSGPALEWWKQVEKTRPLTIGDRREYATSALESGELVVASEQIKALMGEKPPEPEDFVLAARLETFRGHSSGAVSYAERVLQNPNAEARAVFGAAVLILLNTNPQSLAYGTAVDRLIGIARTDKTSTALEALRLLAAEPPRPRLTNPARPSLILVPSRFQKQQIGRDEAAQLFENHPNAGVADKLRALQLRSEKAGVPVPEYTATALQRFGSDEAAAPALAAWLYERGEFERVLQVAPLDRASRNRPLYLWRVDALDALGRYPELKDMLLTEYSAIDQVTQHVLLAIISAKLGESIAGTNEWERAMETANTTPKLQMLEQYAEANNLPEIADRACLEILTRTPQLLSAYMARLRLAENTGHTAQAQKIAAQIAQFWPDDTATRMREVYLRLLLNASPDQTAATERQLDEFAANNSLGWNGRASLALARLRTGRAAAALSALEQPGDGMPPPSVVAMHAWALAENGWKDKARQEAEKLATVRLLPEERALIAPILETESGEKPLQAEPSEPIPQP